MWGDIQFTEAENSTCDYVLVLNNLAEGQILSASPEQVWRVVQEPPTEFFKPWHEHLPYASKTFMCDPERTGDNYIQSHPMVPWHIDLSYDFLRSVAMPTKNKLLSWMTSTKTILNGHKKRMSFLAFISGKIPGLDLVCSEVHHIANPLLRQQNFEKQKELGFTIVQDKWAGIAPYHYSLAVENFSGPDYWTEKLADCYLAYTLPIYYGCTNLEKYFPADSFIRIDIEKPEEALAIIQQTISSDSWQRRLPAIMEARELVLHKYQLFPSISHYIHTLTDAPKISVVVCTFNRQQLLKECLISLQEQTADKKNYEILVVDNNSTDQTQEVATTFFKDFPHGKYLFEAQQGLSYARNLGWQEARGEYIAFIDDDSQADHLWLAHALTIITEKKPDIFGGPVFPLFPDGKPEWFKEQYGIRGDMGESGWINKGFIIGTNIFFRKSLLQEYGGFNPLLGMNGYNIGYHEETELVYRAFNEERKVYFARELIVKDVLPDYKKSFLFFLYSKYRVGLDGGHLWPHDCSDWDIQKLLGLIKETMEHFNTALSRRDNTQYPYPENYILDNNLLDNLITIGLLTDFFLAENKRKETAVLNAGYPKTHTQTKPLLSVLIANYNNELYIRDCLESILNQSYANLELIIADDNSTDSSVEIIQEYMEKYPNQVKGIFNKGHCGVACNKHIAALAATGSYLTTLDSDDYYYDSLKLEKEMALLLQYKEEKHQDIIAFSNIVLVNADKSLICFWGHSGNLREGDLFEPIMERSCLIPRDFVMRRAAYFHVGGFDGKIELYEDWDLKIRLATQYPYYYTGVNGTAYRRHGAGLSTAAMINHEKWLTYIFDKNIHLVNPERKHLIRQKLEEYLDAHIRKK